MPRPDRKAAGNSVLEGDRVRLPEPLAAKPNVTLSGLVGNLRARRGDELWFGATDHARGKPDGDEETLIAREQFGRRSPGDGRNGASIGAGSIPAACTSSARLGPRPIRRPRGWCPRGPPLIAELLHGHWRTLAVLRFDRIDAPLVLDAPIDDESFAASEQLLLAPCHPAASSS